MTSNHNIELGLLCQVNGSEDMGKAVERYVARFGDNPQTAHLKDNTINDVLDGAETFGGVRLVGDRQVPDRHVWIPVNGKDEEKS